MQQLNNCTTLFADGTFRTAPHPYVQLYTLHGIVRDRRIPLCFSLLCSKTAGVYGRMLDIIKSYIRRTFRVVFAPTMVISDFELGFVNTVPLHLPTTTVLGCHFHFSKALYAKVNSLGLAPAYQNDAAVKRFVQLMMALAFLPMPLVRNSYNVLRHQPGQLGVRRNIFRQYPVLRVFCTYFENTWLNGPFPIPLWNVYTRHNLYRTINTCEGWHSRWNNRVGVVHPNIWRFIIYLQKEERQISRSIRQARRGVRPRQPRLHYRRLNQRIDDMKTQFTAGQLTLNMYWRSIRYACHQF